VQCRRSRGLGDEKERAFKKGGRGPGILRSQGKKGKSLPLQYDAPSKKKRRSVFSCGTREKKRFSEKKKGVVRARKERERPRKEKRGKSIRLFFHELERENRSRKGGGRICRRQAYHSLLRRGMKYNGPSISSQGRKAGGILCSSLRKGKKRERP